jgi:hypothetical protein
MRTFFINVSESHVIKLHTHCIYYFFFSNSLFEFMAMKLEVITDFATPF